MDCARVDEELVAFHLAAIDGATRAALEAHLVGCGRCVSAYLAVKRAVDAGEEAEVPSEMTRARIKAEAEKRLSAVSSQLSAAERKTPEKRPARRATWAIAATAAAAMIAAPLVYVSLRQAPEAVPAATRTGAAPASTGDKRGETVDTARATPANLAFL